jgi:hypothetical protein
MAHIRTVEVVTNEDKHFFYSVPMDVLAFEVKGDFLHIPHAHVEFDTATLKSWRVLVDEWLPACGGMEKPFISRSGIRLLYCWNPASGKHAYLNCDTDIILTDEEARAALAL